MQIDPQTGEITFLTIKTLRHVVNGELIECRMEWYCGVEGVIKQSFTRTIVQRVPVQKRAGAAQ